MERRKKYIKDPNAEIPRTTQWRNKKLQSLQKTTEVTSSYSDSLFFSEQLIIQHDADEGMHSF